MKLTKLSTALLTGSLMLAAATANAGVTGNVAFTSDYLFRGVSQSSNNSALQGSLGYSFENGLYVSAWGSSIASGAGGQELDTLFGYAGKAGEVAYDVGVMRYNYPGLNENTLGVTDSDTGLPVDADYNEVYASVSAYGAKLGVNYSPDYFAESDKFMYVFASYGTEISGVGLAASVGFNSFDSAAKMGQALGYSGADDSYIDYKVAVSKTLEGVALELAYIGSDIDSDKLLDAAGHETGVANGRAVFTATKAF